VVAANGALVVGPVSVQASGRTRVEVEGDLRARLIALNMIRDVASNLRLSVVQAAGVTVSVEGAVFDPGQVLAGERSDPNKASVVDHPAGAISTAGARCPRPCARRGIAPGCGDGCGVAGARGRLHAYR
jgi:hypothetical protein